MEKSCILPDVFNMKEEPKFEEVSNEAKVSSELSKILINKDMKDSPDRKGVVIIYPKGFEGKTKVQTSKETLNIDKSCILNMKEESNSPIDNENKLNTVFVCSYCNTNFSQMNFLDEHLKFNCTKILSQQSTDKYGENTTKSVFVCSYCHKNFTQMNYLDEHLKFNCTKIKQADKSGEKSPAKNSKAAIQCPICPAPYLLQNGELLKNHMWWVHKKELKLSFSCSFCSEKFHQKDLLTEHITNNCAIANENQKNLDFDSVLVSENPNCSDEIIENGNFEDPLGMGYFISWIF